LKNYYKKADSKNESAEMNDEEEEDKKRSKSEIRPSNSKNKLDNNSKNIINSSSNEKVKNNENSKKKIESNQTKISETFLKPGKKRNFVDTGYKCEGIEKKESKKLKK
jgi:hypothetical protein